MDLLIEKGIDYKRINSEGGNAFMFAAGGSTNKLELFEYLKSLGIEPNIKTKDGNTPLHSLAFRQKDGKVAQFFLDNGVNPNQVNSDGNTAFLNAVRGNNKAIIELLLPLTSEINHKNKNGYTALTFATRNLSSDNVKLLLKNGADIDCIDNRNRNLITHLYEVYRSNSEDRFESLLGILKEENVVAQESFDKGNNLVHLAVEKNSDYLISKALAFGQDINLKNDDGLTPLHLAAMKSKDESLLKLLIEKGADVTILTDFEESVFDLARENELLEKNGVDIKFLKLD